MSATQIELPYRPYNKLPRGTEFFPVVDPSDELLGFAPKKMTHDLGLYHRTVALIVRDPAAPGKILLQQRATTKELYPGLFTHAATGHVNRRESYAAAMQRETREELGVQHPRLRRLRKLTIDEPSHRSITVVYSTCNAGPFQIDQTELESVQWVGLDWVRSNMGLLTPPAQVMIRETLLR